LKRDSEITRKSEGSSPVGRANKSIVLLEKVEILTEFRDEIFFFSNKDGIRDKKSS
jgi:hypothetical protein